MAFLLWKHLQDILSEGQHFNPEVNVTLPLKVAGENPPSGEARGRGEVKHPPLPNPIKTQKFLEKFQKKNKKNKI